MCVWRQEKGGLVTASCSVLEKRNGTEFNFRLRGVETARRAAELRRVCGAVERGELATARSCHVWTPAGFFYSVVFLCVCYYCVKDVDTALLTHLRKKKSMVESNFYG